MSRGLLYCEANLEWQSEDNMAGIEGMKDGSQPERDRPVISQSAALTLVSVSLSECRGEKHNNNSDLLQLLQS